MTRARLAAFLILAITSITACRSRTVNTSVQPPLAGQISPEQWEAVATKKIYFGHQSVGANILEGVRDLMAAQPGRVLNIVASSDPGSVAGPAFVHSLIGQNGDPSSKAKAFAAVLYRGLGSQGGIVMYKYCFLDVNASTDVDAMFEQYRTTISALRNEHPQLKFVHITVPLTTLEPTWKRWLKAVLGRQTALAANVKRNRFNTLLRREYAQDTIFDLAEVESTRLDGTRTSFREGDQTIYTLAPEFTDDGGHLNELGRKQAAARLLAVLASVQ